jgi:DNA (cytosine-5)-methyltransferase 1
VSAYYNDNDPFIAAWLRRLAERGHIERGSVDGRTIVDVGPDDLAGHLRCHFFAGIAGFDAALRLLGWPRRAEIWTGGPPCQDASIASAIYGARAGLRGERTGLAHVWLDLVAARRPRRLIFENVPGIRPWTGEITRRLEQLGYRVCKPQRSAESIGAPHARRRMFVAADLDGARFSLAWSPGSPTPASRAWAAPPGDFWRETKRGLWRMDDGLPTRVAILRAFGNAVVPDQAAAAIADRWAA